MKAILAIGGAVIKTALEELRAAVERDRVEMLIHNGASLFHDFQRATDSTLMESGRHSYPLGELLDDPTLDKPASDLVWNWIRGKSAPERSITRLCEDKGIPVLCFTALGCDFWQLFDRDWEKFATNTRKDLVRLVSRMIDGEFYYLLLGSAVIHPEVFKSALALAKPKKFTADVVDFLEIYRPRTRISKYGLYYKMEFKQFLKNWIEKGELDGALKIYEIKNNTDGKAYIGKTRNIRDRIKRHLKSNLYISSALKKYGLDNFKVSIIDFADSLADWDEKERYWIKQHRTKWPHGYNLTESGDGTFYERKYLKNYTQNLCPSFQDTSNH